MNLHLIYQKAVFKNIREVPERIRYSIELTASSEKRQDELQAYFELRNQYRDDEILLCLNALDPNLTFPLSYLTVHIASLYQTLTSLPPHTYLFNKKELDQELSRLRARADIQYQNRVNQYLSHSRNMNLEPYTPLFPLSKDFLERLATLNWYDSVNVSLEAKRPHSSSA